MSSARQIIVLKHGILYCFSGFGPNEMPLLWVRGTGHEILKDIDADAPDYRLVDTVF
jgi:hypothetical protein